MTKNNSIIDFGLGVAHGFLIAKLFTIFMAISLFVSLYTHNDHMLNMLTLFVGYGIMSTIIIGIPMLIIASIIRIGYSLCWILPLIATLFLTFTVN